MELTDSENTAFDLIVLFADTLETLGFCQRTDFRLSECRNLVITYFDGENHETSP